jgi:hypothetical protein
MSARPIFRSPHILAIALALAFSWSSSSRAENSAGETSHIKVVVRTIKASTPRQVTNNTEAERSTIQVEPSLSDLQGKLSLLPFSSFHLIASTEEDLSLKQKESVRLPNGQTLSFRPMYMEQARVGMWLSWRDVDGSDILNTRIHFDADESVITGTDYHENEGRILAIRALKVP